MDKLKKEEFVKYSIPITGKDYFHALLLILLGLILIFIGILVSIVSSTLPLSLAASGNNSVLGASVIKFGGSISVLGGLFAALTSFIFLRLMRAARRRTINFKKKFLKDKRPPVLFLRAFSQDKNSYSGRKDLKSHEEVVARVFSDIGPVVAVGTPSERLPLLGALRMYFTDDEWQQNVSTLMEISSFTIIQPTFNISDRLIEADNSLSKGLKWEIDTAKDKVKAGHLVFSLLVWQDLKKNERQIQFEAFKRQIELTYEIALPEKFKDEFFIYIDQDNKPHSIFMSRWKRIMWGKLTVLGIRAALKPLINLRGYNYRIKSLIKELCTILAYRLIAGKLVISLNIAMLIFFITMNLYLGVAAFVFLVITYVLDIRPASTRL